MFKRRILIDESELKKVLYIIGRYTASHNVIDALIANVRYYNCGWAKAPKCNCVTFNARDRIWFEILKCFAEHRINLLLETTGY